MGIGLAQFIQALCVVIEVERDGECKNPCKACPSNDPLISLDRHDIMQKDTYVGFE